MILKITNFRNLMNLAAASGISHLLVIATRIKLSKQEKNHIESNVSWKIGG